MTSRDKFIVVALLALLIVASVVAILDSGADGTRDPAYGGTYVEGVTGVPQYLNPVIASTDVDDDIVRLAFSGLTRYDQTGAIVADLAAAFRTESNGKVWTFDIREDALWQDGQPVTADDVVYTVKLLQDRGYVGQYSDAFRGVNVERVSNKTVRFTLPDVYGPFAGSTTVPLLPAHLLSNVAYSDLARQPFNVHPVGSGPFRVSEVDGRRVAADWRGTVADESVPQSSWAYVRDVTRYQYSQADAKALLDAADWKDHDGDGIRDKGGQMLAFTITTSDETPRKLAAMQIQNDLNAVGMSVQLRTMPFGELVDSAARQRSFDALLVEIAVSGDPDPYSFFHSTEVNDPGHNFSGFSTLPIDRNLEAARRTFDEAARRELYAPVFQIISNEVPVVFLYFSDYLYAQSRVVQGLRIAPLTDPRERFWNVEDWYVRTSPRR